MIGKKIELYREKGVRSFGSFVDAVRITESAPIAKKLPLLTDKHPRYNGALEALKDGTADIDMLKCHFEISEEMETELLTLISEVK